MSKGTIKSINDVKTNHTKGYIEARQQAELTIMEMEPVDPPSPTRKLLKKEQELFNEYISTFTELNVKHSQILTTLVLSTTEYNKIMAEVRKIPVLDEMRPQLEKRALAYSKEIAMLLKEISNIRTQQFKQAIDMAKVQVENKKAEAMTNKNDEAVNPLLEVLNGKKKGVGAQ